ncbi:MAG: hypothetical protein A2Y38_12580 [Spirochaetes bacterium GWB1_59_5]|nr:MAG: hypothetical protein A2Y38_12580 [Spirochaetes bacterium GWB1_59_5]
MKKLSLLLVALALFTTAAFGLELKDGRMKLVIDEKSGRFSLYYLAEVTKSHYVPLLYSEETRTTYSTLSFDQKTYKLGDASDFRVSVAKEAAGGVRIEYRSSFCVVKQTFSFVTSPGASMSDGVTLEYSIENVSQKDTPIGLRVLFDTWLGEKTQAHFSAQSAGILSGEVALSGEYADSWIRSAEATGTKDGVSLQIQLSAPATKPERVLAANWKRLSDAVWAFEPSTSRNFTLLPYSINDSAVALYFEPITVRPGSTRRISTILSQANDGYPAVQTTTESVSPALAITAPAVTAPLDEMVDLVAVRDVLDAINIAIGSGAVPTVAELEAMDSIVRQLETRKAKY